MFLWKKVFCVLIAFTYFSRLSCSDITSCYEEFTVESNAGIIVSFSEITSNVSSLVVNVSETVLIGEYLHQIMWVDPTYPNIHNDADPNTALHYDSLFYTEGSLIAFLNVSMRKIVDYDNPDRQDNLQMGLYYDFTNIPDSPCKIDIIHVLQDENTATPSFEFDSYRFNLREDFPLQLIIPDIQPMAFDYDAASPNNMFSVEVSPDCLLQLNQTTFTCVEGKPVVVWFYLNETLDYEAMESPYEYSCLITLQDFGSPSQMSEATIILTVTPFPDEDPAFTSDYYSGYLSDSVVGSTVDMERPINATDPDIPSSNIIYSLIPADSTVGGDEYFSINNSTAEIIVIQDLNNDFLSWEIVYFIITACDADMQCSNAYLSIKLPPQSASRAGSLEFEKEYYTAQIDVHSEGETILQVHAQYSGNPEDMYYDFVDDDSSGLEYFAISETSGEITTSVNVIPPDFYVLRTLATDGILTDRTVVNIEVLQHLSVIVNESIVFTSVVEGNVPVEVYTVTGIEAIYFCILDVQPEDFSEHLYMEDNGTILVTYAFDAEDPLGNLLTIKAASYAFYNSCEFSSISTHVLSNEVLIEVEILDVDDNHPYFLDSTGEHAAILLFAYPLEVSLQKAIGPVASLVGKDDDISQKTLTYKLTPFDGYPLDSFGIDYYSGEIHLIGEMTPTMFDVLVLDYTFPSVRVQIEILPLNYISTLYFDNLNQSDVSDKLSEISVLSRVNIYLLYSNVIEDSEGNWKIEAHVYSTFESKLLDWQQLKANNNITDFVSDLQPFSESKYYTILEKSYKTATIILGCVSGFLLVVLVVLIFKLRQRNKKMIANKKRALNETQGENDSTYGEIFSPIDSSGVRDSMKRSSISKGTKTDSVEPEGLFTSTRPYTSNESHGTASVIDVASSSNAEPDAATAKY